MALCGKCGLFLKLDEENHDGLCVWFDIKIPAGEAFTKRECEDFVTWLKDVPITEQVKLKIEKTKIFESYNTAKRARFIAFCSLFISIIAISITIWSHFWH